eukprot:7556211-Lingulodinium_polyedra.AAC.1
MSPTPGVEQFRCVGLATPVNVKYKALVMPGNAQHSWLLQTFTRKVAPLLQQAEDFTPDCIGNQ